MDIDTSDVDKVQEEGKEMITEFADGICDEAINALVPAELQKASCTVAQAVPSASEWVEMGSIALGFDVPFAGLKHCRSSQLVKRVEVQHALQNLGC